MIIIPVYFSWMFVVCNIAVLTYRYNKVSTTTAVVYQYTTSNRFVSTGRELRVLRCFRVICLGFTARSKQMKQPDAVLYSGRPVLETSIWHPGSKVLPGNYLACWHKHFYLYRRLSYFSP